MKRILPVIISLFLTIPSMAFANEDSHSDGEESSTKFSGFIDLSYVNNGNSETDSFKQDQIEIDIEHTISSKVSARLDLNFLESAEDDISTPKDESKLSTADVIEQAYIDYQTSALILTFGKFNIPMGAEGGEPTEMLQYSYALINDHGIPGDITGVMATFGSDVIEVNLYAVNGNDMVLSEMSDDNSDKTIGGHISLSPSDNFTVGLSHISGKEGTKADGKHNLSITDIDFNWTPIENLHLVAQYNNGTYDGKSNLPAGGDAKWDGYLIKANYHFNHTFGTTIRYDYFNDKTAERLEGEKVGGVHVAEKRSAVTIAALVSLADGLEAVFEYKTTTSDEKTMLDKDSVETDKESVFAAELVYSF